MRIGIKVADDILKRMEPFRHLTNVSQICRDAIEAWVDSYERARNRAREDGMEAVAARLQSEHAEQTVDWEALGHEDAKLWVQMATLEDFETLFHNLKVKERQGRSSENWIPHRHIEGTKTYWNRHFEHKEWFYRQYELDYELGEKTDPIEMAETKYNRAWLFYVTAVWQMVRERIAADSNTRLEALMHKQAKIELPEHLR